MENIGQIFKALSDETRVRIIRIFLDSDKALCVCELVDVFDLPQYQVSRQLAALKNAGLMTVTKKGTWAYHRLNDDSPFAIALWQFLRTAPLGSEMQDQLRRDLNALSLRLALRENGACVVGLNVATMDREDELPGRQNVMEPNYIGRRLR